MSTSNRGRAAEGLAVLDREPYSNLTTFRRDGSAVATPVWQAVADGRIYVVGGAPSFMHPKPMDVVEIYDPESNTWETGPPLVYPRRSHAVVATPDGKLYAIGGTNQFSVPTLGSLLGGEGKDEGGPLASVEVLDTTKLAKDR